MKDLQIVVRISNKNGDFIENYYDVISVSGDVALDDYEKLFNAMRQQCPVLYDDFSDCEFEITDVWEV